MSCAKDNNDMVCPSHAVCSMFLISETIGCAEGTGKLLCPSARSLLAAFETLGCAEETDYLACTLHAVCSGQPCQLLWGVTPSTTTPPKAGKCSTLTSSLMQ
eukprot:scaffold283123_cov21-Tisochrysis_lutea.AAC.2